MVPFRSLLTMASLDESMMAAKSDAEGGGSPSRRHSRSMIGPTVAEMSPDGEPTKPKTFRNPVGNHLPAFHLIGSPGREPACPIRLTAPQTDELRRDRQTA